MLLYYYYSTVFIHCTEQAIWNNALYVHKFDVRLCSFCHVKQRIGAKYIYIKCREKRSSSCCWCFFYRHDSIFFLLWFRLHYYYVILYFVFCWMTMTTSSQNDGKIYRKTEKWLGLHYIKRIQVRDSTQNWCWCSTYCNILK